jgi:queuine tRNA-ribosyltransferase
MSSLNSESFFKLTRTVGSARRGHFTTAHGVVQTPAFMPVGTSGAVKAMTSGDLEEIGAEIILGNTYHLYLRPGTQIIKSRGGLASFNSWRKPTLTDSGGFQVFSLSDLNKITDNGVEFQSHHDGSRHVFTPEKSIEIQHDIGADIIMAFDQCVPYPCDEATGLLGVERTFAWAKRSLARHEELSANDQWPIRLFGIVQGSVFKNLRTRSAEEIVSLDFPGNAIGGLSVGEPKDAMEEMLGHTIGYLPIEKPRYLMGVGYPEDILMAVSHGIDMFDCVLPTRNARTGAVFTSEGPLVYRNADCANDDRPLDPNCGCKVCQRYSRAYIRHMYNQKEITGMVLATYHSCYFFQDLMRNIRTSLDDGTFESFKRGFLARYQTNTWLRSEE